MEENKTEEVTQQQEAEPADPAEKPAGRFFTQEEINRIVSDRLKKYKAKAAEDTAAEFAEREKEFKAREAKLAAKEFIQERGYPADLADLLDTSDIEQFKKNADRLVSTMMDKAQKQSGSRIRSLPMADTESISPSNGDRSGNRSAFSRNGSKHVPKNKW